MDVISTYIALSIGIFWVHKSNKIASQGLMCWLGNVDLAALEFLSASWDIHI